MIEKGKRCEEIVTKLYLDWSEWCNAYVCSRWSNILPLGDQNLCRIEEILRSNAWCGVCPWYEICVAWCGGREKVFHLCHHNEKLAIMFGLMNIYPSTPFHIVKNLCVCEDYHTFTKFI
jgi:hypothetical protein